MIFAFVLYFQNNPSHFLMTDLEIIPQGHYRSSFLFPFFRCQTVQHSLNHIHKCYNSDTQQHGLAAVPLLSKMIHLMALNQGRGSKILPFFSTHTCLHTYIYYQNEVLINEPLPLPPSLCIQIAVSWYFGMNLNIHTKK